MNILFYSPEFHDWNISIKKIRIPDVRIYVESFSDLNTLVRFVRDKNISIIIPTRFNQMKFIINNSKPLISKVKKIICPNDYDIVETLDNKIKFREFMIMNGFDDMIPITYQINKKVFHPIIFPCIFKLAKTYSGMGSHICETQDKLQTCQESHKEAEYFIQEFIHDSNEYGAHLYIDCGNIKWGVCYKTIHPSDLFIQKGKMLKYDKVNNFDFSIFEKIFIKLNYTGFVCIDFKIVDNNIKIFEINPRLGGTIVNNKNDLTELIKFIVQTL
jgi:glutathione synthase/RimK-type ligase-like ATP-grasp enzyme